MPLTERQRAALESEAKRRGLDVAALIREAESLAGNGNDGARGDASADAKPTEKNDRPLYMYHLPFVTVNEVRTIWLGLDPIAGGEKIASKWAAEQSAPPSSPSDEGEVA
jgi:hypothetical protein